ncbi:8594_t:CDS:2 [Ambispora gerdemannii]|uniref:8594_t:CDS:1 n=1 Tax=Ambispora gerdemannii TaxID=144530 RepID=A0A9N8YMB7_9GLOM|nr:8594_t:CDS:2 [Ambispora gerdemannii]
MPHAIEQSSTSTFAQEHFLGNQQLNSALSDSRNFQLDPSIHPSDIVFFCPPEEQYYNSYDQSFSEGIKTSSSCDLRKEELFFQNCHCCGLVFDDFNSLIDHKQVVHSEYLEETGVNLENTYGLIAEEGWNSAASVSSAGSIPNSAPHSPQEDRLQDPAHQLNYVERQSITDRIPETSISVNLQDIRVFGQLNNRSHNNNKEESELQEPQRPSPMSSSSTTSVNSTQSGVTPTILNNSNYASDSSTLVFSDDRDLTHMNIQQSPQIASPLQTMPSIHSATGRAESAMNQVAMVLNRGLLNQGQTRRSATASSSIYNSILEQPYYVFPTDPNQYSQFTNFHAAATRPKRASSFSCTPTATILDNSEYINNNNNSGNYGSSGVMMSTGNRGSAQKPRRNNSVANTNTNNGAIGSHNKSHSLQQRHNQLGGARLTSSAPATPTANFGSLWPQSSSIGERENLAAASSSNFNIGGQSSIISGQVPGEQRRLSAPSLSTPLNNELSLSMDAAATSLVNDNPASSGVYGYSAVSLSSIYPIDQQRGMKRNREDGSEMEINQKRMNTEITFWDVNDNLGTNTSMMSPQKSSKKRPAVTAESARRKVSKSLGGPIAVAAANVPVVIDDAISISANLTNAIPAAQPLPPPQIEADKPYRCCVEGCPKTYKNANGLKYHRTHGHNTEQSGNGDKSAEKPYKCPHGGCSKSYKNLNGLKYHLEHSHNGVTASLSLGGGSSSGITGV